MQLCFLLACPNLWTWRRRQYIPLKHPWNFTKLHGVTTLKIVIILKGTCLPLKSSVFGDIRISRFFSGYTVIPQKIQLFITTGVRTCRIKFLAVTSAKCLVQNQSPNKEELRWIGQFVRNWAVSYLRWLVADFSVRVWAEARSSGICGGQSHTEACFSLVLIFPLPIFILLIAPHSSAIIRSWYNSPNSGQRTKWTQSHSKTLKKEN
jgi:hypothetical protein